MLKPEENDEVVTLLFKTGESVMKTLGPRQGGFLLAIVDGDGSLCLTSNAALSSLHPFLDAIRAYLDDNVKNAVMVDLAAPKEGAS